MQPNNRTRPVVGVRLRPAEQLSGPLRASTSTGSVWHVDAATLCTSVESRGISVRIKEHSFSADHVFSGPAVSNREVYASVVRPLVDAAVLHGASSVVLAWGQTSSGKTHTMHGAPADPQGMVDLALHDLLERPDMPPVTVWMSCCQIHLDQVTNLLGPSPASPSRDGTPPHTPAPSLGGAATPAPAASHLPAPPGASTTTATAATPAAMRTPSACQALRDLRRTPDKDKHPCGSFAQARALLQAARQQRALAATKLNQASSRSHMIVQLDIEGGSGARPACIMLVDLAGSEDPKKSGASGKQLQEAISINLSLHTLQNVVNALASGNAHIPFEDSTLTRKLKPCLSPGSMVAMLVTIRSEEPFKQESIRSLEMARTALRITCKSVTPLKALEAAADHSACRRAEEQLQQQVYALERLCEELRAESQAVQRDAASARAQLLGSLREVQQLKDEAQAQAGKAADLQLQLDSAVAERQLQEPQPRQAGSVDEAYARERAEGAASQSAGSVTFGAMLGAGGAVAAAAGEWEEESEEGGRRGAGIGSAGRAMSLELELKSAQDVLSVLREQLTATHAELEDSRATEQELRALLQAAASQQASEASRRNEAAGLQATLAAQAAAVVQVEAQLTDARQLVAEQDEELTRLAAQLAEQRGAAEEARQLLARERESARELAAQWAEERGRMQAAQAAAAAAAASAALEEARREHEAQAAAAAAAASAALEEARREHEAQAAALTAGHVGDLERARREEREATAALLAEQHALALEAARQEHAAEVAALGEQHALALEAARQEALAAAAVAAAAACEAGAQEQQQQERGLQGAETLRLEMQEEHEEEDDEPQQLALLQKDLQDLRDEHLATSGALAEARRRAAALSSQLDASRALNEQLRALLLDRDEARGEYACDAQAQLGSAVLLFAHARSTFRRVQRVVGRWAGGGGEEEGQERPAGAAGALLPGLAALSPAVSASSSPRGFPVKGEAAEEDEDVEEAAGTTVAATGVSREGLLSPGGASAALVKAFPLPVDEELDTAVAVDQDA